MDLCGTQNIPTFWACFNVMSYFKGEITPEYINLCPYKRPEVDSPKNSLSAYIFGFGIGVPDHSNFAKSPKNPVFDLS